VVSGEQQRSGFGCCYSIHQVECSRNLPFTVGAQTDRVYDSIVNRTRSRPDMPTPRTLFGAKHRPSRRRHR
jgi:hypothetical protein